MFIGVLAAIVGNTLINYVVRKYRKTWFVIAILAAIVLLSTVLLGYTGCIRTLRSYLQVSCASCAFCSRRLPPASCHALST